MKTVILSTLLSLFALTGFAARAESCDSSLVLECRAEARNSLNQLSFSALGESRFADENWDEPSLANCASTVYITIEGSKARTTLRLRAERNSGNFAVTAGASQVLDLVQDGQVVRKGYYSKTNSAEASLGNEADLGHITFPLKVLTGSHLLTGLHVYCEIHN